VPGRQVAGAEFGEGGPQPAGGRRDIISEPHDPHVPIIASEGAGVRNSA
jgi:hypothetical protein